MGFLRAEVVRQEPSRDRFAELARDWFAGVRELLPDLDRRLAAGPSLAFDHLKDRHARMGPPNGAYGMLTVQREPALVGGKRTRYSDRAWQRMLDGLAADHPYEVYLTVSALDETGERELRPGYSAELSVRRLYRHPDWILLRVMTTRGTASGDPEAVRPLPGEEQTRLAEFVKTVAARLDAPYAHVTDDPVGMGGTALEDATRQDIERTVPRCREALRGYSWVTVCAPELARCLGGAAALAAAFAEATELPGGGVYLRATPLIQDYTGPALRTAFSALAPVLIAGVPDPYSPVTPRARLVREVNAADYRRPAG